METIVFDGGGERKLLIGLITSKAFCLGIKGSLEVENIQSRYVKTLVKWCLAYFDKYSDAPGPDIEDLLKSSMDDGSLDESDGAAILKLLKSLDVEFKDVRFNVDHYLTGARKYLREARVKALKKTLDEHIASKDIDKAEMAIVEYTKRSGEVGSVVSLFDDSNVFMDAFDEEKEYLFSLPGALGRLMNEHFVRDAFIELQAGEKCGKTFFLDDLAFRGWLARNNVALFQCGDLSKKQQVRRLGIRMVGRSDVPKYCRPKLVPVVDCRLNQDDTCCEEFRRCDHGIIKRENDETHEALFSKNKNYTPCSVCRESQGVRFKDAVWWEISEALEPLTWREAKRTQTQLQKGMKGKRLLLDCYPQDTLTPSKLESVLDEWEISLNFVPDIIVIDYSDIMACDQQDRKLDKRLQEDSKWKALRRISAERHVCLITATQSKILTGEKELQDRSDFTESKTKYAHATAVFTINKTDQEEAEGTCRVAPMMVREGEINKARSVRVFQALHRGKFFVDSCWHSELKIKKNSQRKFFKKRD